MVEHGTFNAGVASSNLAGVTNFKLVYMFSFKDFNEKEDGKLPTFFKLIIIVAFILGMVFAINKFVEKENQREMMELYENGK